MNKRADFSVPFLKNHQQNSNITQESLRFIKRSMLFYEEEQHRPSIDIIPDFEASRVPHVFPKLSTVNLPVVREIGVKESIKELAAIYDCKKYNYNLMQFWFLDFMTDCLWKVQDEFQFPKEHQKIILEWVSYIFNLIRDPHLKLSRKQIFKIFNEALRIAEMHIETGCEYLPLPEDLFILSETVKSPDKPSGSSSSSLDDPKMQTSDVSTNNSNLIIEFDDGVRFFDLPEKVCPWNSDNDYLSSTVETVSENEIAVVQQENSDIQILEEVSSDFDQANALMFEDFYKPDLSTPSRFAHSEDSLLTDSVTFSYESESLELEEDADEGSAGPPTWIMSRKKTPDLPCPSFEMKQEYKIKSEKEKEEDAIQSWYDYHLWQFRKKSINDAGFDYFSNEEKVDHKKIPESQKDTQTELVSETSMQAFVALKAYVANINDFMKEFREHIFVNTCVIMAIREIVYDYFYDSFQFSVIKMVYRFPHLLQIQALNKEWHIPKKIKGEVKRPKPKKKKVEKPKKEKPHKVESVSRAPVPKKKISKLFNEQAVLHEGGKRDYEEEKMDLERIIMEHEMMKEMERKEHENRTLVFPLTDAVDETFFLKLFPSKQKKIKKDRSSVCKL